MMKFSLLQSFLFFTLILQASWCLANEGSDGEKLATLPRPQAEEGTFKDAGLLVPQTNSVDSTGTVDVPNVKYPRKLRNMFMMQVMSFSHKGGAGGGGGSGGVGGGGGGGGGGTGGVGGGKGTGTGPTGGSGSESNHQDHKKKNSAIPLANPWIYLLLEIGMYAIATLPFTLI